MIPPETQNPAKKPGLFRYIFSAVAVAAPLTNVPQLVKIWVHKNAAGVSVLSWLMFATISVVWFIHGVKTKDKTMMFMFFSLTVAQLTIALGAHKYG